MDESESRTFWILSESYSFRREVKKHFGKYRISTTAPADPTSACLIGWDCRCECRLKNCLPRFKEAARYPQARVIVARALSCSEEDWPGSAFFWMEMPARNQNGGRSPLPKGFIPFLHRRDAIASVQTDIFRSKGKIGCMKAMVSKSGYSRTAFSAKFKTMTGRSPKDYANRVRLCHALWELVASDKLIKTIALEYGYHPFSFSRAFQRAFGVSPSSINRP